MMNAHWKWSYAPTIGEPLVGHASPKNQSPAKNIAAKENDDLASHYKWLMHANDKIYQNIIEYATRVVIHNSESQPTCHEYSLVDPDNGENSPF